MAKIRLDKVNDKKVRVIGNGTVDLKAYVDSDEINIKEKVNYAVLKNILEVCKILNQYLF